MRQGSTLPALTVPAAVLLLLWLVSSLISVTEAQSSTASPTFFLDDIATQILAEDQHFGRSVGLRADGSALVVGSSSPSGTGNQYAKLFTTNATSNIFEEALLFNDAEATYTFLGARVSASQDRNAMVFTAFDSQRSVWVWWYFSPSFNTLGDIENCSQSSTPSIAAGYDDTFVVGCEGVLRYYEAIFNVPQRVGLNYTTNGPVGDLAMSQYMLPSGQTVQTSLGTTNNEVRISMNSDGQWRTLSTLQVLSSPVSPYIQAAIWKDTVAVVDGNNTIALYVFTSSGAITPLAPPIPITSFVSDIALVGDNLVVAMPARSQIQIFSNLANYAGVCFEGVTERSVSSMTVSTAATASNLTIAVGVAATTPGEFGVAYILEDPPCSYIPPQTSAATTATTTTATTTATTASTTAATTATSTTIITATTVVTTAATTTVTTAATTATATSTTASGNTKPTCSSNLLSSIGNQASCNSNDGTWTVAGDVTANTTIIIQGGDSVNINGNLSLSNSSALELHADSAGNKGVYVGGIAQLGGNVVIIIESKPNATVVIPLINAMAIQGSFSSVNVVLAYSGSKCYKTESKPEYTSTSASLLITTTKKGSCGGEGRTTGIAVGVTLGLVLIIVIITIVGIILWKKFKQPEAITIPSTNHLLS